MRIPNIFRRLLPVAALALLSGAASGAAAQSAPGVDNVNWGRQNVTFTADALRAFNHLTAGWASAWREGDAKEVSDFYSVGAAVAFTDELIRGRDAVLQTLSTRMPRGGDLRLSATDFVSSGDVMSATGPFVLDPGNGELVTGSYSMTLRLENGRWKIRSQVFSPALPLRDPVAADSVPETSGQ